MPRAPRQRGRAQRRDRCPLIYMNPTRGYCVFSFHPTDTNAFGRPPRQHCQLVSVHACASPPTCSQATRTNQLPSLRPRTVELGYESHTRLEAVHGLDLQHRPALLPRAAGGRTPAAAAASCYGTGAAAAAASARRRRRQPRQHAADTAGGAAASACCCCCPGARQSRPAGQELLQVADLRPSANAHIAVRSVMCGVNT